MFNYDSQFLIDLLKACWDMNNSFAAWEILVLSDNFIKYWICLNSITFLHRNIEHVLADSALVYHNYE